MTDYFLKSTKTLLTFILLPDSKFQFISIFNACKELPFHERSKSWTDNLNSGRLLNYEFNNLTWSLLEPLILRDLPTTLHYKRP